MKFLSPGAIRSLPAVLCLSALLHTISTAQQPQQPQADVLRVKTELVQTAVTVVDKDGRFVDGLNRDHFELLVDGKPRSISFFERVTAGSPREAQLAVQAGETANTTARAPAVHARRIIFFVDDLHLSPDSLDRTKKMLRQFLDHQLSSRDFVTIVSSSGQIGFLQQFSNNKQVLEAAMARLNPRVYDVHGYGTGSTRMTEYAALSIDTARSDNKVQAFYIGECLKLNMPSKKTQAMLSVIRKSCETQVKNSARAVLMQASEYTRNTYISLESLMRSSARAPGRKLAFFVSDGFLMDAGAYGAGIRDKLDRVIDAAQRAGVVMYTIDARGLNTNGIVDAGNTRPHVGSGDPGVDFALVGEVQATQDAMHALAGDTGGRALRNTNYFDRWVEKVLDETSNYYLVAWRPENEEERAAKFRHVKVNIIGRPELTARSPKGYVSGPSATETAGTASPRISANHTGKVEDPEIRDALSDYYPNFGLPTVLSLTYLNTPKNETVLTSSIQVAGNGLNFGSDGNQPATLRLAGVVLDDKGKIASSFKNQLNVKPIRGRPEQGAILYNEHTPLRPGIYQVRVAARDEKSGRVGSAMQWIVIPDLTKHQLTLSSLLLGGQVLDNASTKDGAAQVQLSVDHRFARSSKLEYWAFVYNAKRDAGGTPILTVKSEVRRDGQLVVTAPPRLIKVGSFDPDRVPFGEELSLKNLSPGSYELLVTIADALAGTAVNQSIEFEVY